MTGRYVQHDYAQALHSVHGCAWCGWGGNVRGDGSHTRETCTACGVTQCNMHPECRACLYGWMPGWSRGYVWDGARNVSHECGYKGCTEPAVAKAPRVGRVCMAHLARAKVNGETLANVIAERRAEAIDGHGGFSARWRRMVWRAAVGHEDDPLPVLPPIPGATWELPAKV